MPGKKSAWKDEFILKAYQLGKSGIRTDAKLAEGLGVAIPTLAKWLKKKPAFRQAVDESRLDGATDPDANAFHEYVYHQLSPELRELWEDLMDFTEDTVAGAKQRKRLLERAGLRQRQGLYIHAWVTSFFSASEACRKVGIPYSRVKKWMENDPSFQDLCAEIHEHKKNFFEAALIKKVKQGDTACIIMANKTFNKDRGYGEKVQLTVDGEVDVNHHHSISIENLNLDLKTRKKILQAIREQNENETKKIEYQEEAVDAEYTRKEVVEST